MKYMTMLSILFSILFLLNGCAALDVRNYEPVTNPETERDAKYRVQLRHCQRIAAQVDPWSELIGSAIAGAAVGAAFGSAVGAIDGHAGTGAQYGSTVGAFAGSGQSDGFARQRAIVRKCLERRGWEVYR